MFNIICFFRLRWNFIPCNTQNLRTPFHELFKKCIQKYTLVQPKPLSTCSAWLPGSSLMSLVSKLPPSPWEIFILIISHHRLAWHILELHIKNHIVHTHLWKVSSSQHMLLFVVAEWYPLYECITVDAFSYWWTIRLFPFFSYSMYLF